MLLLDMAVFAFQQIFSKWNMSCSCEAALATIITMGIVYYVTEVKLKNVINLVKIGLATLFQASKASLGGVRVLTSSEEQHPGGYVRYR